MQKSLSPVDRLLPEEHVSQISYTEVLRMALWFKAGAYNSLPKHWGAFRGWCCQNALAYLELHGKCTFGFADLDDVPVISDVVSI